MVATLYLVSRSTSLGEAGIVNGVRYVLINADSGRSSATIIAEAISACNAAYNDPAGPSGNQPGALDYSTQDAFNAKYFDTVQEADVSTSPLNTDKHALILAPNVDGPIQAVSAV